MPQATTKNRTTNVGRAASHGLTGVDALRVPGAAEIATAVGFGLLVEQLASVVDDAARATSIVEQSRDLTASGRSKRRTELGRAAFARVREVASPVVDGLVARVNAALAGEDDARPVTVRDILLDYADGSVNPGPVLAAELADRIRVVRDALLDETEGEHLSVAIRAAAADGDAVTMVAVDALPDWLRDRLLGRAAIDAKAWAELRRAYRRARNPERSGKLDALAEIGQHLVFDLRSVERQLIDARLTSREAQAAIDAVVRRVSDAMRRMGSPLPELSTSK